MNDQTNLDILVTQDHWTIATVVLSFSQTTLATGLITFRIWKIDRASSKSKASSLLPVIQIVVESGLLYMLFLLADLVALVLESPALLFRNRQVSPITSIAFFLIIVRVGLSKHGGSNPTLKASEPGAPMGSIVVHNEYTIHRGEDRDELSVMEGGDVMRLKDIDNSSSSQVDA